MAQMPIAAIAAFASDELFLTALAAPHPSANVLAFEILRRWAPDQEEDISGPVFLAALRCWLERSAVEVGARGQDAIANLLARELRRDGRLGEKLGVEVGDGRRPSPMTRLPDASRHRLWGMFLLGEGHEMIAAACQAGPGAEYRTTSLAQGRLLGLLPEVARLDFEALWTATAGGNAASRRILWWASTEMADREDLAMGLAMVEFYKAMVKGVYASEGGPSPWFGGYLEKLKDTGMAEVERAARELANEAGLAVARGEDGATEFGEWLEEIWN